MSITKEQFIDEFLDRLYMCGHKNDDGHYVLSLKEATAAASELFDIAAYPKNEPNLSNT